MSQDSPIKKRKKRKTGNMCMLSVFFLLALRYTKKLSFFEASCLARVCGNRIPMGRERFSVTFVITQNALKMLE